MMFRAFLLSTFSLAAAGVASAQPAAPTVPPRDQAQDHVHQQEAQEIVVTAPFVRNLDLLAGTTALSGAELARDIRPQLGDTLARLPGVSATSFSPGASRPVLRGFQGERVRVLTDGIGSIDVSNTSADHAVTIDPITSDRIEVLHGPAVLLFGSQAIGGAVNVFDRRIPRSVPDDPVHIDALASLGSAADERSIGGGIDVPLGGGLVVHLDGSHRVTNDLRTGGYLRAPGLRAQLLETAAEEEAEGHGEEAAEARALAGAEGRLPNSATETTTAGLGVALIRERGNIGFSISLYDSRYGVPSRPGAEHHHGGDDDHDHEHDHDHDDHGHDADTPVSIALRQVRADLRGEVELGQGLFERLRIRLGAADYEHIEYEGAQVGTVFATQGMEGRFELVQRERSGWRGVVGGQVFVRDFAAIGPEAFLPPNTSRQMGLFALQEVELGAAQVEGAVRYEHADVEAPSAGPGRSFDSFSAAVGASYELAPLVRAGLNLSRSQRAPSAEELFSDGPHIATQAYEVGDPGFGTESSLGGELYLRAQLPGLRFNGSLFYNRFNGFIYAAATGAERDELPVFQYYQSDAEHWGFEMGAEVDVAHIGDTRFSVDAVADYVQATVENGDPLPRIPPLRLLGGIEARAPSFDARLEVEHAFAADRIADFETPTAAFTLVNASLTWRPWGRDNPTSLILSANNIFDVEARRHASFTKDYVPLAGRDLRATFRVSF